MSARLRPGVHAAQVGAGLLFSGPSSSFVMEGPAALAQLWQWLCPRLEQGASRAQLLPPEMPDGTRAVAERLLGELEARAMLLSEDLLITDPVDGQREMARWLEALADDPAAAWRSLRAAEVTVVLAESIDASRTEPLVRTLEQALGSAGVGCVRIRRQSDGPEIGDSAGATGRAEGDAITLRVGSLGTTGADLLLLGDQALVAPWPRPAEAAEVLAAPSGRCAAGTADRSAAHLVAELGAHLLVHRIVRNIAGISDPQDGKVAVIDGEDLRMSYHPVVEIDSSRAADESDAIAELLDGLAALTDERFGRVRLPHPGDLPQVPAPLALAHGRLRAIVAAGSGENGQEARLDALFGLLRQEQAAGPVAVGWSSTELHADAVVRAVAHATMTGAVEFGELTSVVHPTDDLQIQHDWEVLASHFGIGVRVELARGVRMTANAPVLPRTWLARVITDDVLDGLSVSPDPLDAVRRALRRSLARRQAQAAQAPALPDIVAGLLALGVSGSHDSLQRPGPDQVTTWVEEVEASLSAGGYSLRLSLGEPGQSRWREPLVACVQLIRSEAAPGASRNREQEVWA